MAKSIWQQGIEPREYYVIIRVWCAKNHQFGLHKTKNIGWNFGQYIVVYVLDSEKGGTKNKL